MESRSRSGHRTPPLCPRRRTTSTMATAARARPRWLTQVKQPQMSMLSSVAPLPPESHVPVCRPRMVQASLYGTWLCLWMFRPLCAGFVLPWPYCQTAYCFRASRPRARPSGPRPFLRNHGLDRSQAPASCSAPGTGLGGGPPPLARSCSRHDWRRHFGMNAVVLSIDLNSDGA